MDRHDNEDLLTTGEVPRCARTSSRFPRCLEAA
jgi:hypothetical protein